MYDFFNKEKYTQKDIEFLLENKIEESLHLDYKESRALEKSSKKTDAISKVVSSFANSDGGIVLYGIEEKDHKPINYSFINGNEITKEWLEQIIHSNIFKKIEGLYIEPIRFNNKIENTIYLVKIPHDSAVPHMAIDNKFYRRYNFSSVPMEEYEIRNLYFRKEKTELKLLDPIVHTSPSGLSIGKLTGLNLNLVIHVMNVGITIEKLYKLEVLIPEPIYIHGRSPSFDPLINNHTRNENAYSIFSFPNVSPLFQNEKNSFNIRSLNIKRKSIISAQQQPIKVKLYYSGGIDEMEIDLNEYLKHINKFLTEDDFAL